MTIDMLLHHTSGYRQYTEVPSFVEQLYANPFRQWAIQDIINIGVEGGPTFTPGTNWVFSDTDTLILQQVIEKVTGRPIGELLQKDVFDRLGMHNTTAAFNANWPTPVLHGYTDQRGVWEDVTNWNPSWTAAAGGLGSNQEDARVPGCPRRRLAVEQ